jgi:hypothetical protein
MGKCVIGFMMLVSKPKYIDRFKNQLGVSINYNKPRMKVCPCGCVGKYSPNVCIWVEPMATIPHTNDEYILSVLCIVFFYFCI